MSWPRRRVEGGDLVMCPGGDRMVLVPGTATGRSDERPAPLPEGWVRPSARPERLALLGVDPGGAETTTLDEPAAEALVHEAVRGRVVPALSAALRTGTLAVPHRVRVAVERLDREVQETSLAIEETALHAQEVLVRAGVRPVVLKGLATAHLDHPGPHLRQMGDVDLLVGPADFAAAERSLLAAGFASMRRAGGSELTPAVPVRSPRGVEVDLHRLPTRRPYGGWWLERGEWPDLATCPPHGWAVLPRADRLVHAVAHHVLSTGVHRRLSSVADALALWPRTGTDEGWPDAVRRWRAATLVSTFRRLVAEDLGIGLPELPGCPTGSPRWYEGSVAGGRGVDAVLLYYGRLSAVPPHRAPAEVWHMVFPGPEALCRAGHRSWTARTIHGVRHLYRSRRGTGSVTGPGS
ncbi:nucleotidyltransferase family protein [Iamia majanohamensis]|uniref:Nucleotidyltransferase family protein n=1 Tax=Iamia majanohamensis TaxID=467976 RepID=A0AAF0BSX4_9ACTN|nr:nucleotidyltransferase family protein [Iamia majanohamensis]WCO65977.1 nucleotidyltransferase family protein [Iamia majanohamensis]